MSRRICIQAGHLNTQTGETGAPRELERNKAIGLRVWEKLKELGVDALFDDAVVSNDPKITSTDWDLYLSLHCDMNYSGDEGGGFADYPDPSTDFATVESQRICQVFVDNYFKNAGIRYMPSRRNLNTSLYYMWKELTAKTACVLLEMGESIDPHDSVILNDTERQANIIVDTILKAFPDIKKPEVVLPHVDCEKKYNELLEKYNNYKKEYTKKESDIEEAIKETKTNLINKLIENINKL